MWISGDGSIKVEVIQTTCKDPRFGELVIPQYKAERWSRGRQRWIHIVTTANINILAHRIGLDELDEFPPPNWEDDAMRYGDGDVQETS